MDDIRAVMDACASERAVVPGVSEGAPMAALFGATYPDRTVGLILYGGFAKARQAPGSDNALVRLKDGVAGRG
jgi:pimeloyl-ACP methyl ester carboxylesterase